MLAVLYKAHRQRALAIARRILRDPQDAEDVVQDVFLRLHSRPPSFEGRSAWTTWLHRVMVNSSINSLRERSRAGRELPAQEAPAPPDAQVEEAELRALFLRALQTLEGTQAEVVYWREVKGRSYPEIAALLQIPEGSVKSALHRGRARVLEELERLVGARVGATRRPSAPRTDPPCRGRGR